MANERGAWRDESRPCVWPDPGASVQTRQFWAVFEARLSRLAAHAGRVFMMREFSPSSRPRSAAGSASRRAIAT
ncbi:MAG: hypothetical protein KGL43_10905 [Burkholderiales bacterium]|nr:hypothetical protein [Burkholderiales bacterium]MDE2454091.1 hypothetical protein [Burkholderiales bacterium]